MADLDEQAEQDLIEIAEEAQRRLQGDAVFATLVHAASAQTELTAMAGSNQHLTRREKTIANVAASIALVLAERDPKTGARLGG